MYDPKNKAQEIKQKVNIFFSSFLFYLFIIYTLNKYSYNRVGWGYPFYVSPI